MLTLKNSSCIPSSAVTSSRMHKRRATMLINRKTGEQIKVDWAGDTATIIDSDTGEIIKASIFVGVMTYSQYTNMEAFLDTMLNTLELYGQLQRTFSSISCNFPPLFSLPE